MNPSNILIVENGMLNRKLISEVLKNDGYSVCYATDAKSALTTFTEKSPFFILVSLMLLKVDTCVFSRILKNDEDTHNITIVGLSPEIQNKNRMIYCGFDGFINMTENNEDLIKKIREYLNKLKKIKLTQY